MIVLRAKSIDFQVTYVDLNDKPDWFLEISPHGRVPVLKVDGTALFESNAIAEFLDDEFSPRLHPADPIKRSHNRAWADYVQDFEDPIEEVYAATSAEDLAKAMQETRPILAKLEGVLKQGARQRRTVFQR